MTWVNDWFNDANNDWFGLTASPDVPGSGPSGVATFALNLQNGYTVTYRWVTDVIKMRSGVEQRISRNDQPKEIYQGSIVLFGDAPADLRTQLAQYAAQGETFLIGLPHEEMSARLPSVGTTYYVHDTSKADWMNLGQRVVVVSDGVQVEGVIQSTTSDSITLDIEPGAVGGYGSRIMPARAIYLQPEQSFPRYATEAERWDIDAVAATFGFSRRRHYLDLGPITSSACFDNVRIVSRIDGFAPTFSLQTGGGITDAGELLEADGDVIFQFKSGITTMANMATQLAGSAYVVMTGTWTDGDTIALADVLAETPLAGGQTAGPQGTGATLTEYSSRPVWDRALDNDSQVSDSIQAMTEILDYGGLPQSIGSADQADWGRSVAYSGSHGPDWQWFKLFMATVVGRQKAFWLSTYRDDLPCVSSGIGTLTVVANVGAWWPSQRRHVQVDHAGGTSRYEITAATNNGDGTWTITIGATLTGVTMVSWLELSRFTSDEFAVTFDEFGFGFSTTATVVQR